MVRGTGLTAGSSWAAGPPGPRVPLRDHLCCGRQVPRDAVQMAAPLRGQCCGGRSRCRTWADSGVQDPTCPGVSSVLSLHPLWPRTRRSGGPSEHGCWFPCKGRMLGTQASRPASTAPRPAPTQALSWSCVPRPILVRVLHRGPWSYQFSLVYRPQDEMVFQSYLSSHSVVRPSPSLHRMEPQLHTTLWLFPGCFPAFSGLLHPL